MRTRMYGGVRGRKTKVGGKPTFVFLLLDYKPCYIYLRILAPSLITTGISIGSCPYFSANDAFAFDMNVS